MCQPDSTPSEERELWLEKAVLLDIVTVRPRRLSHDELAMRMDDGKSQTDRQAVQDALQSLKRSGLVRLVGDVVEPTLAATCAAVLFDV